MKYTPRLENAIRIASQYHHGQFRKEHDELPYISHPFSVASLVSNFTEDEDIIIAALLHDTVEDTEMTHEELIKYFGERVSELVDNVSEPKGNVPWKERKDIYLKKLEDGPADAVLIAAADKVHNMQSKYRIHNDQGFAFVKSLGLLDKKYVWYHSAVYDIVKEKLGDSKLVELYKETLDKELSLYED